MFQRVAFVLLAAAVMSSGVTAPFGHLHAAPCPDASPDRHGHGDLRDHAHAAAGIHRHPQTPGVHAHVRGRSDAGYGPDAGVTNLAHPGSVVSTASARECPQAPAGLDPMVTMSMDPPPPASITGVGPSATRPPPDPPPLFRGAPRAPPHR